MFFLKLLIGSILASNYIGDVDRGEWFPVEKKPRVGEVFSDVDPSIWVVFSKRVESEGFLVRLPEDPLYQGMEGGFILKAADGAEIFEISVQKREAISLAQDSVFELDGRWIHERIVQTDENFYRLRTYTLSSASLNHEKFISSFYVFS